MVVLQRKKSKAQERVEDSAERMEGLRGLDFSQTEVPASVQAPAKEGASGARGGTSGGDSRFKRTERAEAVRDLDFGADNFGLPGPDSSGWGSGSTGANAAERGGVTSSEHDPSKVPPAKDPSRRVNDPAFRDDEEIARNPGPADDPAPDPDVDGDGLEFGEIARIREQQERERDAMRDDRERARAEAILDADSRAGLGGMGLSGATSALIGDTARVQDRETALLEADMGRRHRDEGFNAMQRQVAIWDMEMADMIDLDGDGFYGPPGEDKDGNGIADDREGDDDENPEGTISDVTDGPTGNVGYGEGEDQYDGGFTGDVEEQIRQNTGLDVVGLSSLWFGDHQGWRPAEEGEWTGTDVPGDFEVYTDGDGNFVVVKRNSLW